ncbi:MAG: HAD family phosphatase [Verrucomicrobiales bacterium]
MTKPSPDSAPAVIFDMDGTLFDTEPLYCEAYRRALEEQGMQLDPEHYHRSLAGTSNRSLEQSFAETYGCAFDLASYRSTWSGHFGEIVGDRGIHFMPGIALLLEALAERQVRLAVASSSDRREIEHFLSLTKIHHRFTAIAAGDEVRAGKPDPEIFLLAASRLGVEPSNCIAIEDSNHGVAAAHAAGMTVVMTPSPAGASNASKERAAIATDVCAVVLEKWEMLQSGGGRSAS